MRTVTLEELLESGCHFGHQVTRQNTKARDYIFAARDGIHIIDLEKTKEGLEEAGRFVKDLSQRNGILLILGTKRQTEGLVEIEIKRAKAENVPGLYYVTKRWVGGVLTNFAEVSKNFRKLKDLERKLHDENEKAKYTKKEIGEWEKERAKLESFYGGIADLTQIPDALFIIDTHLEHLAVHEALRMGVKTVGITDTNADPTIVDYPIPANDDAVGSIKLILHYIIDAWIEGKKVSESESKSQKSEEEMKKEKIKNKNNNEKRKNEESTMDTKDIKETTKKPVKKEKASKITKKEAEKKVAEKSS